MEIGLATAKSLMMFTGWETKSTDGAKGVCRALLFRV
jgi:hypothetical protein